MHERILGHTLFMQDVESGRLLCYALNLPISLLKLNWTKNRKTPILICERKPNSETTQMKALDEYILVVLLVLLLNRLKYIFFKNTFV